MTKVYIHHPTRMVKGEITLDGSKSISNRVLLIRALCGEDFPIHYLSTSDDTKTMASLLEADVPQEEYDCHHAGTTFRFLTAYFALQSGTQILTGSERMQQRPIGPLVDALRQIGAQIDYVGADGYPPLRIGEMDHTAGSRVEIRSDISSQYISALMMIAPTLPHGLGIHLTGEMVSESYLQLTIDIMRYFGVEVDVTFPIIKIAPQSYTPKEMTVEADWSAASYYYSIVALAADAEVYLKGLHEESFQGDSAIQHFGSALGVRSQWQDGDLILTKCDTEESFVHDFINCPDIAQTIAVICASKGIDNQMTGLQTLKIKETDRITALDQELEKVGGSFLEVKPGVYSALPADSSWTEAPTFETYKDHRMAMAFAPLALVSEIKMHKPGVVTKSYPGYWEDLEKLGFRRADAIRQ